MTGKCKGACGREPGWEVLGERVLQLGFRGPDGAGARSWPRRTAQALGLRGKGKWGKTKPFVCGETLKKQSWALHMGSGSIYEGRGSGLAGRLEQTHSTAA